MQYVLQVRLAAGLTLQVVVTISSANMQLLLDQHEAGHLIGTQGKLEPQFLIFNMVASVAEPTHLLLTTGTTLPISPTPVLYGTLYDH